MRTTAGLMESLSRLRPSSPAQLALIGAGLLVAGLLIPALGLLKLLGLAALAIAGLTALLRPRPRVAYWRGRRIDLSDASSFGARLYRLIYR
jgi:membrane-bound ClpP family serine protease